MTDDDDFTPRPGRSPRERGYRQRVLQGIASAGGRQGLRKSQRFTGSRIGRGSGVGRVLRARDQFASYRSRRVIVQARIVKLAGRGLKGARRHLRYLARDGVTRDGKAGTLYDQEHDKADGRAFADRADGDRHQFRFIVSAEDGAAYDDLKPVIRRLMARMEEDLRTKLDWVAADHYNTGYPHSHVILRGKDEMGHDLIIARDYIAHGLRERAAEIVSLELGPRSDFEVQQGLRNEIEQERFTSLDHDLLRQADGDGCVAAIASTAFRQTLRAGRLQKLQRLGLAEQIAPGQWQLAPDLRATLRRLGERGDIIKTMHRELTHEGALHTVSDYAIYDGCDRQAGKLIGRIIASGLSDELHDRHYLIVDGVDGRAHYVDVGATDPVGFPPVDGIVAIVPNGGGARPVDRTIAKIAAAHDGHYSAALHAQQDLKASPEFVRSHLRRLEALRRAGVSVERLSDGTWSIAPDHVQQVGRYEQHRARANPVQVEMLCALPVERQISADGATWLDRELVATSPVALHDAGFGRTARQALERRRLWLIEQGLARMETGRTIYPAGMMSTLQRRELAQAGAQLSHDLHLPYAEAINGARIEGVYARKLDLASGRFAVIEKSREFTLVPWRPVLERNLGKQVSGLVRGDAISWSLERQRGGPAL